MTNPQQPEMARSRKHPGTQDHDKTVAEMNQPTPADEAPAPVPEDNRPDMPASSTKEG